MRIGLTDYWRFSIDLLSAKRIRHELQISKLRDKDVIEYIPISNDFLILDLANGRLRPQYSILKSQGFRIIGIDLLNRHLDKFSDIGYSIARFIFNFRLNFIYQDIHLDNQYSFDQLTCGNVNALPFRTETFHLVTCVAAFEHFMEVDKVIDELFRVLKSGGLVWACIHLFTSPSGGHNVNIMQIPLTSLPKGVEPWDHLRKRRLAINVPLNEWRACRYIEAFSRRFEILNQYCAISEGEHFLSSEIETELSDYTRDELTCGAYVIVARKPVND